MLLTAILFVIMFMCIALMWNEGLWGSALMFVNVLFAGMLAMNFYEPVANYLEKLAPSLTYAFDFLSLWAVFVAALLVLRTVTDQASRHAVRFKVPLEIGGQVGFAILTAWVFACFTMATLHTAPLARTALRGSFEPRPLESSFLGLHPDRYWLAWIHSRSLGALSRQEPRPFDAEGDWIFKYAQRRFDLQTHNAEKGTIRVERR